MEANDKKLPVVKGNITPSKPKAPLKYPLDQPEKLEKPNSRKKERKEGPK